MLEIMLDGSVLRLEHSLAAIREWEACFKKPFFSLKDGMTPDESAYYIQCMTIGDVDRSVYSKLTQEDFDKIARYINEPRTATKFYSLRTKSPTKMKTNKTVTSEVLYQRMIVFGIPFECQYWHIDQLTTLMQVCQKEAGTSQPKMSKREAGAYYRKLNEERRKKMGTRG